MRLLLGGLLLLALFGGAALWQRSWTSAARSERDAARTGGTAIGDGWSRVVVGRPSGGEPYVGPVEKGSAVPPVREQVPPGPTRALSPQPADTEITVQSGQSLSKICQEHYGTARLAVIEAVARYNHLADPDTLREGQKLRLPHLESLLEKH